MWINIERDREHVNIGRHSHKRRQRRARVPLPKLRSIHVSGPRVFIFFLPPSPPIFTTLWKYYLGFYADDAEEVRMEVYRFLCSMWNKPQKGAQKIVYIYLYMLILVDRANIPSIVKNRDSGKVKRRWRDTGCGSGADRQKAARCFIDIFCLLIWNTAKSKIYNLKSLTMLEKKRIVNYSKHMIKST